jgi:thymidylate synthase (FAD)
MDVKLVSYSAAVDGLFGDNESPDLLEMIAYCARVSNPANQLNSETSEKLVKYLIKHQHWSPLEMVNACLMIDTTRDIAHQIVRHRSFAFQEFSQRYANPDEMGYPYVLRECRLQDDKNRQNSVETDDEDLKQEWYAQQKRVLSSAQAAYKWAIDNGIAKEQARAVLPEGLTKTRLYMNGTLRSWIHYISLRASNGTQKEHMDIARACASAIAEIFPMTDSLIEA